MKCNDSFVVVRNVFVKAFDKIADVYFYNWTKKAMRPGWLQSQELQNNKNGLSNLRRFVEEFYLTFIMYVVRKNIRMISLRIRKSLYVVYIFFFLRFHRRYSAQKTFQQKFDDTVILNRKITIRFKMY